MEHSKVCLMNGSKSCEPSSYLFSKVIKFLELNNHSVMKDASLCDTAIINTCGVTNAKIREADNLITKALSSSNVRRVIIFGCVAEITSKYKDSEKAFLIGPKDINKFNDYFKHNVPIEGISGHQIGMDFDSYQNKMTKEGYYIMVSQGCIHNCSYCNIKKAKGNVSSKESSKIIAEIKEGVKKGHSEFVLLSDDCGSYGQDIGTNLAELVSQALLADKSIKLKIYSIFPADLIRLYSKLKDAFATGRISYVNIPIQSGSEKILKLMNRDYDIKEVLRIVREIKEISPKTWIYTHILINFPSETREDFEKSLESSSYFDEALFITYSDNASTDASFISPKVSDEEQEARTKKVQDIVKNGFRGKIIDKQN